MKKDIKKKVCVVAAALSAVLVVALAYNTFISPNGYWQSRMRKADEAEYMEKRLLWRKSENMTMQRMLQDMTLLAGGDSATVCCLTNIPVSVYREFIHGTAQPKRLTWANTRYWYMTSIFKGRDWMQQNANDRKYKAVIFLNLSHSDVQTDTTKDFRKEQFTSTEATCNNMYPELGKPADKEFEAWRNKKNERWVKL